MTLLDTGSGTNLLERKYVHPRDLSPSQQSVRAANGTKIRIVEEATVSMQIGSKTYCVPGLVTDQMSGLRLGLPWLKRYHLIWKLCDNWVTLDNQIVDLYASTNENDGRGVEMEPSRQEMTSASRRRHKSQLSRRHKTRRRTQGWMIVQRQPLLWTTTPPTPQYSQSLRLVNPSQPQSPYPCLMSRQPSPLLRSLQP